MVEFHSSGKTHTDRGNTMATVVELRKVASDLKIAGRSKMGKTDLMRAITQTLDALHAEANVMNSARDLALTADSKVINLASAPLHNSIRIDHYKRQTGRPYLTARQARRVRKHAKKHADRY